MQLFVTEDVEEVESVSAITGKVSSIITPAAPKPASAKDRGAARGGAKGSSPVAAAEPKRESTFAARERLRAERREMVADASRRTGESHREVHARINRLTGAPSVGKATRDQLEKGNAILLRDLS